MDKIYLEKLKHMPYIAKVLTSSYEAWITGSATQFILGKKKDVPKDWDILVPFWQWGKACLIIPKNSITNNFGGIKIKTDNQADVDTWAGDIGFFLAQVPQGFPQVGIQLCTNTILKKYNIKRIKG